MQREPLLLVETACPITLSVYVHVSSEIRQGGSADRIRCPDLRVEVADDGNQPGVHQHEAEPAQVGGRRRRGEPHDLAAAHRSQYGSGADPDELQMVLTQPGRDRDDLGDRVIGDGQLGQPLRQVGALRDG